MAKKPIKGKKSQPLKRFDKYFHYVNSVQSADHDAELLWYIFKKSCKGPLPAKIILQEDFCGTAALCYEWAKLGPKHQATGIDLDAQALIWGADNHTTDLEPEVISKVNMIHGDVMLDHKINPQIICALNFSYFFIKRRNELIKYFKACKESLAKDGILILDSFGGPDYLLPHIDKRQNQEQRFTYWWEIEMFDAISHQIKCHIHYQRKGEAQRKRVFSYDWRLWSIPEITDVLKEAGFSSIQYWAEGIDKDGSGDGKFTQIATEFDCRTWMTYIIAK
jgi:SAM-dependent methyltransferase